MSSERVLIDGPVGSIELVIDSPKDLSRANTGVALRGVAVVAHPHPLHGGSLDNKVAQSLAKTFAELGYVALRPNFRGVGQSAGVHDEGNGETEDLLAVAAYARQRFGVQTLALAGFSFGSLVQSRVAKHLDASGIPAERLVFVGTAVTRGHVETVPADTIVIHGELDDVVPLKTVLDWALPQDLPVSVVAGADHFFHRRLHVIRGIVERSWTK